MKIAAHTLVAVADGSKLNLFENVDSEGGVTLKVLPTPALKQHNEGAGGSRHDSSANPAHGQDAEDDFAVSVAAHLDEVVAEGGAKHIVLVAAPKTLGELRKHLSKATMAAVTAELAKDLTGHDAKAVEKALAAAD